MAKLGKVVFHAVFDYLSTFLHDFCLAHLLNIDVIYKYFFVIFFGMLYFLSVLRVCFFAFCLFVPNQYVAAENNACCILVKII